jgi:hypothetical protein
MDTLPPHDFFQQALPFNDPCLPQTDQQKKPGRTPNPNCGICGNKKVKIGAARGLKCPVCNRRRNSEWAKNNPERANTRNRAHKARNKEKVDRIHRNSKLTTVYGISIDEYEVLLSNQNGLCAICRESEVKRHRNGTLWALSVDHDHVTGKIRGLLCSACNVGIANFRENIEALEAAIEYLKSGGVLD